jgi:ABC-type multidrug transport system fused ATPase/permease subunit
MIGEHRPRLFLAMCSMVVIALATSATAFLVKPVLDEIFFNKDKTMLGIIPIAIVCIYLVRGIGYYSQEYLMNYVGERIIREIRMLIYNRVQDLPVAFYPVVVFGKKVRRASKTCQQTMAELTSFLHETLVGNKIVKAFCAEEY